MLLCLRLCILGCCLVGLLPTCDATAAGAATCQTLSTILPGRVSFPGNSTYTTATDSWFYLENRLSPACIVTPGSAADVSSIIKELANSPSTKFAVKSGGHATNPGWSNVNNGVAIDLGSMNTITVQQERLIASVGPGAVWGDIYAALDSFNLSALGGRASGIGAAGFLLGGGISFFSPQRGFSCDLVANFELVLSSGNIVNANATSNPDLFAALKGGQNNFGIITQIDLQLFEQGDFWGGTIVYPNTTEDQQVAAFTKFKTPANFDPFTSVEQSHVYSSAADLFLVAGALFYSKPVVNASTLSEFTSIQPQIENTMRISNIADFANEVESESTLNQFALWATVTVKISPTIMAKVLAAWKTSRLELGAEVNFVSSMTWQSIPPPADPETPNSFGFSPQSTPEKDLVLILISDFYDDPSNATAVQSSLNALVNTIDSVAAQEGSSYPYVYLNYAADFQNPLGSTGVEYIQQLVAKKYDPCGMFQTQLVGGFKLF